MGIAAGFGIIASPCDVVVGTTTLVAAMRNFTDLIIAAEDGFSATTDGGFGTIGSPCAAVAGTITAVAETGNCIDRTTAGAAGTTIITGADGGTTEKPNTICHTTVAVCG